MGKSRRGLFSGTAKGDDSSSPNKIELQDCQFGGEKCKEHLSVINENYLKFQEYRHRKDYKESIAALKDALDKTIELKEYPCLKCAALFQNTIIESLENVHDELQDMSTGIFSKKRYESSRREARDVLDEFQKELSTDTFKDRKK
ncbi:hypothetical protein SAMN05444280_104115 [Tangfeifania diversioriginum]|uniref:Uncharacterized protein n=1 Tax=Tangfeifania diversioriginum TaxID=1168035 RepID=A0A1M6CWL7_9BACT|nr:hypothetical protein [Tangfeifania diversioriginum]SHI65241.1 hypothetical protein SAMN05444280_104115 [Tangfeifania diversioriginum]